MNGRVIDQHLDANTYTATVVVKSAAQGTSDLSTEISTAPLAPDIRNALQAKLKAFQQRTKDPWVSKWNYE